MNAVVWTVAVWPGRLAPEPAGAAGLALGLLVIVVLTLHQVRADWREKLPTGTDSGRRPQRDAESRRLHWASTSVLVAALVVVFVERIVVLA
ncbi:hypothetical protein DDE18_11320 [Nocardioides gansuensis]|uniref:Uncharacterized protein n=1 Tax=Nocardioides gansuensis TaxID=2138300 RepID=A0A2T8FB30_9ACTN|nr:hypothetical protein [Nocardioides gansuensis]PVG82926.1 hypothetical protein DDE18_11320 [Nocardioides gansuensis]